jgi:serine/threonine-protein kinase
MEYVDGEDLKSLLRRIGRLPGDKAVEIARQICAGLAAAHEKGVLHRDLKPGNVMIDGRGRARLSDFGLAVLEGSVKGQDVRSGTPAYMAPEQVAGREVSVQSDIYSLGLLLYELVTGRQAFDPKSLQELMTLHSGPGPSTPSSQVADLDPAVERAIMRCLEKDPADRPASALAVAASLPGGDPLAAALAAGETPSPEMVAAAGEEGALPPWIGAACVAVILIAIVITGLAAPRFTLLGRVPVDKPPAVLLERAGEVLVALGHDAPIADRTSGFSADRDYLDWIQANDASSERWDTLAAGRPAAVRFWHRRSPHPLQPVNPIATVDLDDPPPIMAGMASVVLDPQGRLLEFHAVPPQVEGEVEGEREGGGAASAAGDAAESSSADATDWTVLFAEAGLDAASFEPVTPEWLPPSYADERVAWEGVWPERPDIPIRIEAAAYRGAPVSFEIVAPWTRPARQQPAAQSARLRVGLAINILFLVMVMIGSALLARRNLRLGRGDRRGAFRLGFFLFAITIVAQFLGVHHSAGLIAEWQLFVFGAGLALFLSGLVWLLYLALEPFVRRRWPHGIVAWTRLLAGRLRDPLIGRDIVIGGALGMALATVGMLRHIGLQWLGLPSPRPAIESLNVFLGARFIVADILGYLSNAMFTAMFLLFFISLGRIHKRGQWIGTLIFFTFTTIFVFLGSTSYNLAIDIPYFLLVAGFLTLMLARFGLLATIVGLFYGSWNIPAMWALDSWFAATSLFTLLPLVALAAYGFYASLGGRPLFRLTIFQE